VIQPDAAVLDSTVLRQAFACFPSGVMALCGLVDGQPVGMAASSFTSVSLEPPLCLVCVANSSNTWQQLREVERLGVSVMNSGHDYACRQLSTREGDRFAGVAWTATPDGAVVLFGAPAWLDCTIEREVPAGDHLVVLLRIHALEANPDVAPLVFHRSSFRLLVP
jgi:flavin reductase (DIM6/NTAB) family NADH-FMN oxidoreductase RutF